MSDIHGRLIAILADQSGILPSLIEPGSRLGQEQGGEPSARCLGFDSLDLIDTAIRVGAEFGIDIPDEHVDQPELGTVGVLQAYIENRLAERPILGAVILPDDDGVFRGPGPIRDRPPHGGYPDAVPCG